MTHPLQDWLSAAEDPAERSQALAALGCLSATGALSAARDPAGVLCDLARRSDEHGTAWRMPPPEEIAAGLPWPAALAGAWRAAMVDLGRAAGPGPRAGPTRLLLVPASVTWSARETVLLPWVLDTLLAPLRGLGHPPPWREVPPALVGTAAVMRPEQAPHFLAWSWPPMIADGEGPAQLIDWEGFHPAARGLALRGRPGGAAEIAVYPDHPPATAASAGLMLGRAAPDTPFATLFATVPECASLVAWLRGGAPDGAFVTSLIYELAHDAPPDLALIWAALILGHDKLPLLFATPQHADEMARARLSSHVRDVAARLIHVARDDPEPLPDDLPLWAFGIGEPASRDPGTVGAAIEAAIARGEVRYDAESMAGEAVALLERELRRREPRPSAGGGTVRWANIGSPRPDDSAPAAMPAPADFGDFDALPEDSFGDTADGAEPQDGGGAARDGATREDARGATDAGRARKDADDDGPRAASAPAAPRQTAAPDDGAPAPDPDTAPEEAERETDLSILAGHFYPGDAVRQADRLPATEALAPARDYTLEVAIRAARIGMPGGGRRSVVNPRVGRDDVTVYVAVSGPGAAALAFEDSLLPLTWPFDRDSTPGFFRFRSPAILPEPLSLSIRLYTADLRLLDLLELRCAAGRWQVHRGQGALPPVEPVAGADRDALALHIRPEPLGFGVEAIVRRDGETRLAAPLGRTLLTADVEALLGRVRRHWTELVIGRMSRRQALSGPGFRLECLALRKLGEEAWRVLFGDRRGADAGAAETLGDMLRAAPLPRDAALRVSFEPNAESFAFPWAILAEPTPRRQEPDPDGLWGLRYRIELLRPQGRRPPAVTEGPVRIMATLDTGFSGVVDHAATLGAVAQGGVGATILRASSRDDVLDGLERDDPPEIVYFFCHGVAASRLAPIGADVVAEIRGFAESLEDDQQKPWRLFLTRLGSAGAGARLFTGSAEISEDDLRAASFFRQAKRPLVFLNACQSADLLPGVSSGLTAVFLDRQAVAVIGTECPVSALFADAFAGALLPRLLAGEALGPAMLAVRRGFHAGRNPLALLYTLYGRGDARIAAPAGMS